jgi:hypothetical protein
MPMLIVAVIVFAWPALRQIWQDTIPSHRAYSREKMRLELLKLLCEVEAIKQQHSLPDLQDQLPLELRQKRSLPEVISKPASIRKPIPKSERLLFGCMGGLAVALFETVESLFLLQNLSLAFILHVIVRGIVLSLIGATVSVLFHSTSRSYAFVLGAAGSAVVSTIFILWAADLIYGT